MADKDTVESQSTKLQIGQADPHQNHRLAIQIFMPFFAAFMLFVLFAGLYIVLGIAAMGLLVVGNLLAAFGLDLRFLQDASLPLFNLLRTVGEFPSKNPSCWWILAPVLLLAISMLPVFFLLRKFFPGWDDKWAHPDGSR